MIPETRGPAVPWGAVLLSVALQVPLAIFLGHLYDTRIFMATGFLAGSGLNPYVPRDLSSIFHDPAFRGLTSIGYPPPWALALGLAWRLSSVLGANLSLYNLIMKLPVIAANVGLALAAQGIAARLGAPPAARRRALLFILFNPLILYTTAAWGQFDSVVALCAFLGVYLITRRRPLAAALLLALAVSLKPTALPLVPLVFLFAMADRPRGPIRFALGLAASLGVFCVAPFAAFGWDPGIVLRSWSAHSSVAGGLSWLTFFELLFGTTAIPAGLRLLGFLWVPALAAGAVLLRPRKGEGLPDLLARGLRLLLVFYLARAWLSEPNVDLLLPFAAALWAAGRLRTSRLHALWLIPLAFTVFNASVPQLLFLVWPDGMSVFSAWDEKVRTVRLLARCAAVIPWLVLGWRLVLDGRLTAGEQAAARCGPGTIPPRAAETGDPALSVIIPTFNEAENIAETVERVESSLAMVPGCHAEIVIVDDGSPDRTAARAEEASLRFGNVRVLLRQGRRGLASAVVDGMSAARGALLAVLDADLQHPPECLPQLVRRIRDSAADVVVMSRYLAPGCTRGWSRARRMCSGAATRLAHAILPATRSVSDPVSGYFIVQRKAVEGMTMRPCGFKILPEILVRGRRLRTEEVAYTFGPRARGRSKMGPVEMMRFAGLLLRLRWEGAR